MTIFQIKIIEEIKTHILCSKTFFENLVIYGIMWKKLLYCGAGYRWQYGA
jgi:hypothetical protein